MFASCPQSRKHWGLVALALLLAASSLAGRHLVTFHSGFTMEADRVESSGEDLILHCGGGRMVFSRADVAAVELLAEKAAAPVVAEQPAEISAPKAERTIPELIREAAEREGLPEQFVRSVAEAESALQPSAVSPKGAIGVMQLMPGTARELGVADPTDPAENIRGGARLLRELLLLYQNHPDQVHRALAAYNAGAGAVQKHRGVPPYRETQNYIHRVLRNYQRKLEADAK